MKESHIQKQIIEWLEWHKWHVAVTSTPNMTAATKGLADLICTKGTRTIQIECKGPKGVQSDEQIKYQDELEYRGGEYLLANSLDVVMRYLK